MFNPLSPRSSSASTMASAATDPEDVLALKATAKRKKGLSHMSLSHRLSTSPRVSPRVLTTSLANGPTFAPASASFASSAASAPSAQASSSSSSSIDDPSCLGAEVLVVTPSEDDDHQRAEGDERTVMAQHDQASWELRARTINVSSLVESSSSSSSSSSPRSVARVIDVLFDLHSVLIAGHSVTRTAASALATSQLATNTSLPPPLSTSSASSTPAAATTMVTTLTPELTTQLSALEHATAMLSCTVCQDVFSDATEASCCGQIYCRACITRWISQQSSTCPICRKTLTPESLLPARHVQRMADNLSVHCTYCHLRMSKGVCITHEPHCASKPQAPPAPIDEQCRVLRLAQAQRSRAAMNAFLQAPLPCEAAMRQCYIRVMEHGSIYALYTASDVLLCSAVKKRQLDMSVSFLISITSEALTVPSSSSSSLLSVSAEDDPSVPRQQVGRLERNFVGSQYVLYGTTQLVPSVNETAPTVDATSSSSSSSSSSSTDSTNSSSDARAPRSILRESRSSFRSSYDSLRHSLSHRTSLDSDSAESRLSSPLPLPLPTYVSRELGAIRYATTFGKTPRQMRVAVPCVVSSADAEDTTSLRSEPSTTTSSVSETMTESTSDPSSASSFSPDNMSTWHHIDLPADSHGTTRCKKDAMSTQIQSPNLLKSVGLINKPPVWVDQMNAYCLDFGGRVSAASVKNFILIRPDNLESNLVVFGRTDDRDIYALDFRHPLSPLQAFGIALSSMDSHLVTFD